MVPSKEKISRLQKCRDTTHCSYVERKAINDCGCPASLYLHDQWKKRYCVTIDLLGSCENRTYLEFIREHDPDVPEIPTFILPDPRSRRWKRISSYIESFCEGASFVFGSSVSDDSNNPDFRDMQEPRAWVSDRNHAAEGLPPPERVYINNPNGTSILALIRTALVHQREGFQELFANYITETPAPRIGLAESLFWQSWWSGHFVISFILPFFAIRIEDREDIRRIFNDRKSIRSRRNLSFLGIHHLGSKDPPGDDPSPPRHQAFLHEAACAFMITGKSERYWTAVFLDEDFHVDPPKLSVEEEEDVEVGSIDPIIVKAEFESADTTASPRAYALATLAGTLREIVEHHTDIQEEFRDSLSRHILDPRQETPDKSACQNLQEWRSSFQDSLGQVKYGNLRLFRKVDEFLRQDVSISPDGLPRSPLWVSVQEEPDAVKSLRSIIASRNKLREISDELTHLVEEAKREVGNTQLLFRSPHLELTWHDRRRTLM
ncbi:hypothetical protein BFJ68_g17403 [Fusarium oxysporum]|uniref:Uncharacterized protein n=1 Tax=Fusarium oxysporum TaxID=5507 RepID=A0A420NUI9_FUSOX|nr:hypothetical protein BFJ68_g17403 [Fusarium oxysporum]